MHSLGPSLHTLSAGVFAFHTAGPWILITEPTTSLHLHTCKGQDIKHTNPWQLPMVEYWMWGKGTGGEKEASKIWDHSVKNVLCHSLELRPYLVHDVEWLKLSTGWSDVTEQTRHYEGEIASYYFKGISGTCVKSNRQEETTVWSEGKTMDGFIYSSTQESLQVCAPGIGNEDGEEKKKELV